jgi:hypothetical protein
MKTAPVKRLESDYSGSASYPYAPALLMFMMFAATAKTTKGGIANSCNQIESIVKSRTPIPLLKI